MNRRKSYKVCSVPPTDICKSLKNPVSRLIDPAFLPAAIVLMLMIGGCGALREPEMPQRSVPGQPVWDREDVLEHLEFLNSSSAAARAPGNPAMATATEYLASRMRDYRLQPVYHSGFWMPFSVREHRIASARLSIIREDSLSLSLSYDFFPDGRSDSGSVGINFVHLAPEGTAEVFASAGRQAQAVMLRGVDASTDGLEELAAAGFRLALVVQELAPISASRPIDGMVVVQVTPRTASFVLGVPRGMFDSIWDQPGVVLRSLPHRLRAEVKTTFYPTAATANVGGYLAGRHSSLARELVIIAADINAYPLIAGERVTDRSSFGVGLAAMLEVARNEQSVARNWPYPMRTLMFVAAGSRGGKGMEELLSAAPWEMDRIRSVIYIGLRPEDELAVRDVLTLHGIELEVVRRSPDAEAAQGATFASARAAHSRSPIAGSDDRPRPVDSSVLLSNAVDAVLELAAAAHHQVQQHAGIVPPIDTDLAVQSNP